MLSYDSKANNKVNWLVILLLFLGRGIHEKDNYCFVIACVGSG